MRIIFFFYSKIESMKSQKTFAIFLITIWEIASVSRIWTKCDLSEESTELLGTYQFRYYSHFVSLDKNWSSEVQSSYHCGIIFGANVKIRLPFFHLLAQPRVGQGMLSWKFFPFLWFRFSLARGSALTIHHDRVFPNISEFFFFVDWRNKNLNTSISSEVHRAPAAFLNRQPDRRSVDANTKTTDNTDWPRSRSACVKCNIIFHNIQCGSA